MVDKVFVEIIRPTVIPWILSFRKHSLNPDFESMPGYAAPTSLAAPAFVLIRDLIR